LGIDGYFEDIIGADSVSCRKPDPGLLIPLLKEYGAEKRHTVVIGDGVNDILLDEKYRNIKLRAAEWTGG